MTMTDTTEHQHRWNTDRHKTKVTRTEKQRAEGNFRPHNTDDEPDPAPLPKSGGIDPINPTGR